MTTQLPGSPASLDRPSFPRQARAHAIAARALLVDVAELTRDGSLNPPNGRVEFLLEALAHAVTSLALTEIQPPRRSVRQVTLEGPAA